MKKEQLEEMLSKAEVFELLAGYEDEKGAIHREFQIREMTGEEEELISKPDIKNNGAKVIRVMLERCIMRIGTYTRVETRPEKWREIIQALTVGDQDYVSLKIRELSVGGIITLSHSCPRENCRNKIVTEVDTEELEILPFQGLRELEFSLPKGYTDREGICHTAGTIRFPNGLDREILDPVARQNLARGNTLLLTRCVQKFDEVSVTEDVMRKLPSKDREYLINLLMENRFGVDMNVEITCPMCGESFKGSLNAVNFM